MPIRRSRPIPEPRTSSDANTDCDSAILRRRSDDSLLGVLLDGRYEIVERIGKGGMGAVYRAKQKSVGRDVAIKVLSAAVAQEEASARRFENEAKIISELRHPNTLKLIDSGRIPDGRPYIVTELLLGESLKMRLERGALSVTETVELLRQVSESLEEAHARGVIHRDLKPGNIFIEHVGERQLVKVLDFGIAKLSHGGSNTVVGQIFGTPGYMSPEQAQGIEVDPRTDLYSLGIVAYHCLSGAPPFSGPPMAVLAKQISDPVTPLSQLVPSVPPALEELVMRLLKKEPAHRLDSARDLRNALQSLDWQPTETLAEQAGISMNMSEQRLPLPPRRISWKLVVLPWVLIATIAAVLIGLQLEPGEVSSRAVVIQPTPTQPIVVPEGQLPVREEMKQEEVRAPEQEVRRARPYRTTKRSDKNKKSASSDVPPGFIDVDLGID